MDFRTVLAGPIVRRVDAASASVWLALAEPCDVTLRVWNGLESAATTRAAAFEGQRHTRRLGDQLHIVVVTAPGMYLPGQIFSYDIELNNGTETKTLDDLELLKDGPVGGNIPHKALGYEPAMLPSFATCPPELTDLRIVHGSCRLPDNHRVDAMVWIDDLIADGRTSATGRPHQLMLSGDQIYADEPGPVFLTIASNAGQSVLGTRRDSDEAVAKETLPFNGRNFPLDSQHFRAGWRRDFVVNNTRFTSIEAKSHVMGLGEFAGYYLLVWANTLWPDTYPGEGAFLPSVPPPPMGYPVGLEAPKKIDEELKENYDKWIAYVKAFRDGLPLVRRALANVSTYMILDDHDVTDDWNLTALWKDRVYSTDLGRTIVRNALVSYAMFQAWGNDPAAFESGANKDLLDAIERLNPKDADNFPDAQVAADLNQRLGLTTMAESVEPTLKWHYHVDGPRHRLVVLDNRTRRGYVGRVTPPQNIIPSRIADQIPEGPLPAGLEVLVLVAPLVVFGPPAFDELLGSIAFRVGDIVTYMGDEKHNDANDRQPGTWPDAVESWAYAPESFEALLAHLEPYKRVAILSGDLHYASTQAMTYWKKQALPPATSEPPARFAQLISSAIKTEFEPGVVAASRVLGFAQRVYRARIGLERLIYTEPDPTPVRLAAGQTIPRALRRRLKERPTLLPTEGWPQGTSETRPFDAAWRVELVFDERPDSERPEAARSVPYDPAAPAADVPATLDGYRKVGARQIRQLDRSNFRRQIVYANNIAQIQFTRDAQGLTVQQSLIAIGEHPGPLDRPEVDALHKVRLEPTPGEQPPTLARVHPS